MTKLIRKITIIPAYDKRHNNPKKNYGIGSTTLYFAVIGKKGAVSTFFFTNIFLPETVTEYRKIGNKNKTPPTNLRKGRQIKEGSLDFHSRRRKYKSQTKYKNCDLIKGGCYCDGTACRPHNIKLADTLLREGSEAIWKFLEGEYEIYFGVKT